MDILIDFIWIDSSDFLHYIISKVPPSFEATRCCNYEQCTLYTYLPFTYSESNLLGWVVGKMISQCETIN